MDLEESWFINFVLCNIENDCDVAESSFYGVWNIIPAFTWKEWGMTMSDVYQYKWPDHLLQSNHHPQSFDAKSSTDSSYWLLD
jgi:hypothetical protein